MPDPEDDPCGYCEGDGLCPECKGDADLMDDCDECQGSSECPWC